MFKTIRTTLSTLLLCASIAGVLGIAVARQAPASDGTACLSNVKQMSLALAMYTQDYDEKLPSMQSPAAFQHRVFPYVKNQQIFTCPDTGKPFKPNPALSVMPLTALAEPAKAVTLYDAIPHTDGTSAVAYLDWHVKRETKVPSLTPKFAVMKPKHHPRKK